MEAPGCARRLHLLPLLERPGNVAVGGEKRTLPPPPSTPVVGKTGKQRRGERREHCRRLHLLPLLGRQGNVAVGREGNTAAACYPHPVVGKAGKQRRGVRRRLARGAAARQPSSPLKKSP